MGRRSRPMIRGAALVLVAAAALPLAAQVQRAPAPAGNASPQLLQQYQQAAAERSALQAENAQLKKDLEAANGKVASASKEAATLKAKSGGGRALAAARAEADANAQALTQTRAKLQELIGRFTGTTAALAGVETERNQAKQQLASALAQYDRCVERNIGLYDITKDILDRLEKRQFGGFSATEAFTHLQRTRIENVVDEDRARAAELKLKPRESAAIPEAPRADNPPR